MHGRIYQQSLRAAVSKIDGKIALAISENTGKKCGNHVGLLTRGTSTAVLHLVISLGDHSNARIRCLGSVLLHKPGLLEGSPALQKELGSLGKHWLGPNATILPRGYFLGTSLLKMKASVVWSTRAKDRQMFRESL